MYCRRWCTEFLIDTGMSYTEDICLIHLTLFTQTKHLGQMLTWSSALPVLSNLSLSLYSEFSSKAMLIAVFRNSYDRQWFGNIEYDSRLKEAAVSVVIINCAVTQGEPHCTPCWQLYLSVCGMFSYTDVFTIKNRSLDKQGFWPEKVLNENILEDEAKFIEHLLFNMNEGR